jgi:hypothetical protein
MSVQIALKANGSASPAVRLQTTAKAASLVAISMQRVATVLMTASHVPLVRGPQSKLL